jgi:hypothetical protein
MGQYRTYFFDGEGNIITERLSHEDDTWRWRGEHVRCTRVFTDGGKKLTARHERTEDGIHWVQSMTVTLRKIDYTTMTAVKEQE